MEALLVIISCVAFFAFLLPHAYRKYCAMLGWTSIIAVLFLQIPSFLSENNFFYPSIALLSVPFLAITARLLWQENEAVFQLSRAAAVAFLVYAPFGFFEPLGNALIGLVVGQLMSVFDLIGYPAVLDADHIIASNGFRVEIILACTGIQSIAIMLGVAAAVPTTTRQKVLALLVVVPVIYLLNLGRNVFVILAYTGQWFPYLPEIASNGEYGFESFFWAHNVICELLALVALIAIAYGLFLLIPRLGSLADDLFSLYRAELMRVAGRGR
mgnify:CR=1 FL=1